MSETFLTILNVIYQVAVIAFVALQFGWIAKPGSSASSGAAPATSAAPGAGDLGNMLQGLIGNLAGAMKQQQADSSTIPIPLQGGEAE